MIGGGNVGVGVDGGATVEETVTGDGTMELGVRGVGKGKGVRAGADEADEAEACICTSPPESPPA